MQKLLSKMRQAINDYNLIEDGDKIAVGLSGGKDSLTLLHLLNSYKKFSPHKFELIAITLNPVELIMLLYISYAKILKFLFMKSRQTYKKLFSKLEKKIILVLYVQNLDEALFITTQKN